MNAYDVINAGFALVAGWFWLQNTATAFRDEEIKGMKPYVLITYILWGMYCVPFMLQTGSPYSAAAFAFLTFANATYAFAYWLFAGTFNYDIASHRLRWRIIRFLKRRPKFASGGIVNVNVKTLIGERGPEHIVPLPWHWCQCCGDETRHDLDGHCMVCDTKNMEKVNVDPAN
jgi:hypothetical protein